MWQKEYEENVSSVTATYVTKRVTEVTFSDKQRFFYFTYDKIIIINLA